MVDLKIMNFEKYNIKLIKGDASFRKFYRKKNNKNSSIIVFAKNDKKQNLLNYASVNKILLKKKIPAPKLLTENFDNNFIEIEDLGNKTIFNVLKKNNNNILIYKKILKILIKIQTIKVKKILNFKKKKYKIPVYSKKLLYLETSLFSDWYIGSIFKKHKKNKINNKLKKIIFSLIKKLRLPNNTFVHRDFHVSNLMIKKKIIFVIDSQDAVYGNKAYDLASLIDDVRLKTSEKFKKSIYNSYLNLNKKKINIKNFENDFQILSVLRNLKIIGIFTRLAIRDKKIKYLRLIPYAWELIEMRINNNIIFEDLRNCLNNYFPNKIRFKNEN